MPETVTIKQAALRQKTPTKTGAAKPGAAKSPSRSQVAGITLSHPDRVYWEDAGVTKQMLAEYYTAGLGPDAAARRPAACWRWCAVPTAPAGSASSRSTPPPASTRSI